MILQTTGGLDPKALRKEMSPELTSLVDFYSTIVMNSVDSCWNRI
ncbi:MAG: hypothetical protein RIS43_461 [Actinomycetota bacterium]